MKTRSSSAPRKNLRRFALASTIIPAVCALTARAATWTGAVGPLNPADPADVISVIANTTVSLNGNTVDTIPETSISFDVLAATTLTLTINAVTAGQDPLLRSLATTLVNTTMTPTMLRTITVKGTADFAPGALTAGTGPVVLVKDTGIGALILDDTSGASNLAGATNKIQVFDGMLSIVGGGGTANPVSTLQTAIEIGKSGAVVAPVLRIGTGAGSSTIFANDIKVVNTGTLEHITNTSDVVGSPTGSLVITALKTLTVNQTAGQLTLAGSISGATGALSSGGTLKKMGVGTTLVLGGSSNKFASLNVAQGNVDVTNTLTLTQSPTIAAGSTLTLRAATNALNATVNIPTGTLQGAIPGSLGAATTTLSVSGGTLSLGLPNSGLDARLYSGGDNLAHAAFGAPDFPSNTYANYTTYFSSLAAPAALTTTGANGVADLTFGPASPMFANIAPTFTALTNFVSRFQGKIVVPATGLYTFGTSSDKGSMLYIDGATVVANNRYQGVTTVRKSVALSAGTHDIDIGYYQGGGGNALSVDWDGPSIGGTQNIPNSVLLSTLAQAYPNPITVPVSSTIKTASLSTSVPSLSLTKAQTLTLQGLGLSAGVVTLTGGAGAYTFNVGDVSNPNAQLTAQSVSDGGVAVTVTKNGPGRLIIESTGGAQFQTAGSTIAITDGSLGVVLGGGSDPVGTAPVSSPASGINLTLSNKGASPQTIPATNFDFNNGGSLAAEQIGSGIAGTTVALIHAGLTGTRNINAGSVLTVSSTHNYVVGLPGITGGGDISMIAGSAEVNGVVNTTGNLDVSGGTFAPLQNFTAGSVNVDHATLAASANLTSTNAMTFMDATLSSTGPVAATNALTLTRTTASTASTTAASSVTLVNSNFANTGTITATAGDINATDSTFTAAGGLAASNAISFTRTTATGKASAAASSITLASSTLSTTGAVSATGAGGVTLTSSTLTAAGAITATGAVGVTVTDSTLTSGGLLTATNGLLLTRSTATASAGTTASTITVANSTFNSTGPVTLGAGGISVTGTTGKSVLNFNGGSVSGGPISATNALMHAGTGTTTVNSTATFTSSATLNTLKARYTAAGVPGARYRGNTEAGILAMETLSTGSFYERTLTTALSFGPQGGADAAFSAFFNNLPTEPTEFTAGFFGYFNAPTTGLYRMQTGIVDDDAGFWIDLDGNGIFQTTGASGNELIAQSGCCGDGQIGSVMLQAGHSYKVAIGVEDGQGGSSLEGRFALPGQAISVVNPSDPAQNGLWSTLIPNQVLVDAGAELRINAINGATPVLVNGTLRFQGAADSKFDALIIGAGGVVNVGAGTPDAVPGLASASALPVPEPGSGALLLAGMLGLLARRRGQRA